MNAREKLLADTTKNITHAGDDVDIPKHGLHRIESNNETLIFLEIAIGTFDENDIERLDDKYGRT
jgi:hypothetical protein